MVLVATRLSAGEQLAHTPYGQVAEIKVKTALEEKGRRSGNVYLQGFSNTLVKMTKKYAKSDLSFFSVCIISFLQVVCPYVI